MAHVWHPFQSRKIGPRTPQWSCRWAPCEAIASIRSSSPSTHLWTAWGSPPLRIKLAASSARASIIFRCRRSKVGVRVFSVVSCHPSLPLVEIRLGGVHNDWLDLQVAPVRLELSPTSWRGVRRHAGLSGSLPTGGFTLGPPRLFFTSSRAPAPSRVFSNSLASAITPCELAHDASTLRLPIGIGTRHKVVCLRGGQANSRNGLTGGPLPVLSMMGLSTFTLILARICQRFVPPS